MLSGYFNIESLLDVILVPTGFHFGSKNPPKSYLGGVLGRFGGVLARLAAVLEAAGAVLEASWAVYFEIALLAQNCMKSFLF